MKRIFLFTVTNLAVLALLTAVVLILGPALGVRIPRGGLGGLLFFAAIFGFGGAFISLALSNDREAYLDGRPGHRRAPNRRGAVAGRDGMAPRSARRRRHARGRHLRRGGDERVRHRSEAQCGAGGREHGVAAQHVAPPDRGRVLSGDEISHVANGDMVTLALLQGVVNTFVIFLARIIGSVVDRALFQE